MKTKIKPVEITIDKVEMGELEELGEVEGVGDGGDSWKCWGS